MRKLLTIVAFMSMAMLVSCTGNKVEGVAKKFLDATAVGDFTEAKKYCDDSTASMIGMMESMFDDAKKKELKAEAIKFEIKSSEIKDDKATVKYTSSSKSKPAATEEKELKLIKVGDDWKVTMGKETPKGNIPNQHAAPAPTTEAAPAAAEAPATQEAAPAPAAPAQK